MKPIIAYILASLFFATACGGTNYFVSNGGNDSNAGTSIGSPFLTLQHAADQVVAGDTVFVLDGTYVGFDLRDVNGASASPIVFKAMGDSALINVSGPLRDDGINIENADYIVIDGFIVNDMPGSGNGVRVVLSDNCVVRNCRCDNNAERGIFTGFTDDILIEYNTCTNSIDEHGIYVSNSSDRPVIRYNHCYGNNATGIHMNGDLSAGGDGIISDAEVYGNILHDNNLAAGINMDGCVDAVVYNNLIYNNHSAQGIAMFQIDGAVPTHGARIFNNTIIVPSDGRWGILVKDGCNQDTRIYNNIIINQHAWRGCITVEDTTGFLSDYNIVNDRMSASGDGSVTSLATWQSLGLDAHSEVSDPLDSIFADTGSGAYWLKVNSQPIDAGTSLVDAIVTDDIRGAERPFEIAYDVGAYEFTWYCDTCWAGSSVAYVDSAVSGGNGTSWAAAFDDLQDALFAARYYPQVDTIWVAEGTYYTDPTSDRSASFTLRHSTRLFGGFEGSETSLGARDPSINICRLSGDIGAAGQSADNAFHVVTIDSSCTDCELDGFTITSGNSNGVDPNDKVGSAIDCLGQTILANLTVQGNLPLQNTVFTHPGALIFWQGVSHLTE